MTSLSTLWRGWRAQRELRAKAERYVTTLFAEPADADVKWLSVEAGGDADHARWELRYARRAMGLLTAQRDALDDRTASLAARELATALSGDPHVAPGKLRVAEQQLNVRISAYADALTKREGAGSGWHLGRTLLRFAGHGDSAPPEAVARAGDIVSRYLAEANAELRKDFGTAMLPEDIAPSEIRR